MPVYAYKGVTKAGKSTKGFLDADSQRVARARLRRDGVVLTEIVEQRSTTAVSARMLLLARLTLVFGFNLLLMLVGSVVLSLTREDLSLWPLVMSWFAPMSFLSALAFLMSVLLMDALAASLIGLLLWMAHVLIRARAVAIDLPYWLTAPGLSAVESRPLLLLAALALTAVALWLAGLNERYGGGAL